MPTSNALYATTALDRCADETFDLVIVGGGITGAGVARHASLAGLKVALFEANDFASGTSSRSSKLIHGGLRYLAMGDVALVRETALERKSVHQMAAHLAEPQWMVLPVRSRASLLKFRAGIGTYERLGAVAEHERHRNWRANDLAQEEPLLRTDQFPYACAYREYLTDDARLTLAVLRAAAGAGAQVFNYARVERIEALSDCTQVRVRSAVNTTEVVVRAKAVVNAAGPWAESLAAADQPLPKSLHLSRGVHISLPHAKLPLRNMLVLNTKDKRSIFAIPRGRVTYVGTTDTSFEGDADLWPPIERADVDYLLEPLNDHFAIEPLIADDVVAAWAGLRPLIFEPGKAAKEMSRKDEVWVSDSGLITIAGGKLTGFRKMAESVMQEVARVLDTSLTLEDPLQPLPGGDLDSVGSRAAELSRQFNVTDAAALRLVRLYGSEAEQLLADNPEPLSRSGDLIAAEVDWAVQVEGAATLEDLLYRRMRSVWYEPADLHELLPSCAQRMADLLHWDEAQRQREIEQVQARVASELAFKAA